MDIAEQARTEPITVQDAREQAKEKGQQLKAQASERAREQVESRTTQAAEQVQSFAQTIRRTSAELRAQGQQGQASILDQAALRAEQLGRYLTESDSDSLVGDAKQYATRAKDFARQQPLLLSAGGLTLGILVARAFKR